MPITQDRMIAILDEAERAHDALSAFRQGVQQVLDSDLDDYAIVVSIAALMVSEQVPGMPACAVERAHFARVRKRNEKNAQYMAAKRSTHNEEDGR